MNIQDKSVLDYDSEDVLENEQLQMSAMQKIKNKRKQMLRDHANKNLVPTHNEELEEDWAEPGDDAKILSKYDDVGEVAKQKKKSK